MTVLLYAVTEAGAAVAGPGLDARPLRVIVDGDLAAVVSDHDGVPAPTEPNLWAYEDVIERLMASSPVAPARFGTTADGDADVRTMLAERHDELCSAVTRLAGTVEFAVHTTTSQSAAARGVMRTRPWPSGSGTDYMLTRLTEERRGREMRERAEAAVGDIALASTSLPHAPERLAYLIRHEDVDAFVGRLIALDDPGMSWTGPWPPYSFTGPGEAR